MAATQHVETKVATMIKNMDRFAKRKGLAKSKAFATFFNYIIQLSDSISDAKAGRAVGAYTGGVPAVAGATGVPAVRAKAMPAIKDANALVEALKTAGMVQQMYVTADTVMVQGIGRGMAASAAGEGADEKMGMKDAMAMLDELMKGRGKSDKIGLDTANALMRQLQRSRKGGEEEEQASLLERMLDFTKEFRDGLTKDIAYLHDEMSKAIFGPLSDIYENVKGIAMKTIKSYFVTMKDRIKQKIKERKELKMKKKEHGWFKSMKNDIGDLLFVTQLNNVFNFVKDAFLSLLGLLANPTVWLEGLIAGLAKAFWDGMPDEMKLFLKNTRIADVFGEFKAAMTMFKGVIYDILSMLPSKRSDEWKALAAEAFAEAKKEQDAIRERIWGKVNIDLLKQAAAGDKKSWDMFIKRAQTVEPIKGSAYKAKLADEKAAKDREKQLGQTSADRAAEVNLANAKRIAEKGNKTDKQVRDELAKKKQDESLEVLRKIADLTEEANKQRENVKPLGMIMKNNIAQSANMSPMGGSDFQSDFYRELSGSNK